MIFSFIDIQNANDSGYHLQNDALWSSGQRKRYKKAFSTLSTT